MTSGRCCLMCCHAANGSGVVAMTSRSPASDSSSVSSLRINAESSTTSTLMRAMSGPLRRGLVVAAQQPARAGEELDLDAALAADPLARDQDLGVAQRCLGEPDAALAAGALVGRAATAADQLGSQRGARCAELEQLGEQLLDRALGL